MTKLRFRHQSAIKSPRVETVLVEYKISTIHQTFRNPATLPNLTIDLHPLKFSTLISQFV